MPAMNSAVDAWLQQALAHHRSGDLAQAGAAYQRLLAQQPQHADATHLLGFLRHQQGDSARAAALIEHAIALSPGVAVYHANLAIVLLAQGQADRAEAHWLRAHWLDPQSAETCNNLGARCSARGQHAQALAWFEQAVALQPALAMAHNNLGLACAALGQPAQAVRHFQQAVACGPDDADAHNNLGSAWAAAGRHDASVACYRQSLALRPDHAATLSNLVTSLTRLGQADEGLALARQAVALQPGLASAWTGLGTVLQHAGAVAEAHGALAQALALDPQAPAARLNLALCLLLQGDFAAGWPAYEGRFQAPDFQPLAALPPCAVWQGEPLAGRSLLVQAEQGLGDTLQFARYLPLLKARGAALTLQCQAPLLRLMQTLPGQPALVSCAQPPPATDFVVSAMSLPLRLGTTLGNIPAGQPYLQAEPQALAAWQQRLAGTAGGLRVGLAWQGSPLHAADRYRSMPLATFDALADLDSVQFVSLQRDPRPEPAAAMAARLHDPTDALVDMADMAALIGALDLVISVDTAVCHLAGALGKPVWVLLHAGPDFRWLMGRDDSPWYPTARLFRQQRLGDWGPVIGRVRAALAVRAAA